MGMYDRIKLVFRQSYNTVHAYFVIPRMVLQLKTADVSLSSGKGSAVCTLSDRVNTGRPSQRRR